MKHQGVNFCLVSILLAFSLLLCCGIVYGGGMLKDPIPSMRGRILAGPAARGDDGVVNAEGAEAILYNPAGVIIDGRWDFAFSANWISNEVFQMGGLSYKSVYGGVIWNSGWDLWILKRISFGLSGYYFGIGGLQEIGYDFESCAPLPNLNSSNNWYYDLVGAFTGAWRVNVPGADLDMGFNAFAHNHQMFDIGSDGFPIGWDFGLKFSTPEPVEIPLSNSIWLPGFLFKAGTRLRIIPEFSWNDVKQPGWKYLDTGISFQSPKESWGMPMVSWQVRFDQNRDWHYSLGMELEPYEEFKLRLGYINLDCAGKSEQVNKGITGGFGWTIWESYTLDFCYHHYASIFGFEDSSLSWLDYECLFSLKYSK